MPVTVSLATVKAFIAAGLHVSIVKNLPCGGSIIRVGGMK